MTTFCITTSEVFRPRQNMNQAIQQMEGAAVVAVTESAVLSYICCINISSKPLVTCNNSLDWLSECEFLWCASSQTDQSGLWVLADRHPWLLSTITTLIILHASYCRALPFEGGNQTADERLNNHTALNVLGIACVCVCEVRQLQ